MEPEVARPREREPGRSRQDDENARREGDPSGDQAGTFCSIGALIASWYSTSGGEIGLPLLPSRSLTQTRILPLRFET